MLRFVTSFCVVLACVQVVRAEDFAWSAADKIEIARLAKKAKKNGELFTVTGEVFESRLPTREAAAEFTLYFERLAERVQPLWGTRENSVRLVAIGLHPKDVAWPAFATDRKIYFDKQQTKQQPDAPTTIASIALALDPALTGDALTVASIPRADLNASGIQALLTRLAGLNPRPAWLDLGMTSAFNEWSPASSDADPPRLDAAVRKPDATKLIEDQLATKKDPAESLLPFFIKNPKGLPAHATFAETSMFQSFFVFLLEDKRGHPLFVETCTSLSRGRPVEIEKKQIVKLVPAWLVWAGFGIVPAK